jgi:hypothetical protein
MQIVNIDRQFAPDASRDGCMRVPPAAGSSGAHAAAAAERWHLQGLQLLPWDWSAKLRVRLSSSAPFAVLEEQRTSGLGPGESCCAVAASSPQLIGAAVDKAANACHAGQWAQIMLCQRHICSICWLSTPEAVQPCYCFQGVNAAAAAAVACDAIAAGGQCKDTTGLSSQVRDAWPHTCL